MGGCGSKAVPDTTPPPNAIANPSKAPRPRVDSRLSLSTVGTLDSIFSEMAGHADLSAKAAELIASSSSAKELPAELRGELALSHGILNKMLATRIDSILTGELVSGKDEARAKRKALVKKAETLIETVEGHIKAIDELKQSGLLEESKSLGDVLDKPFWLDVFAEPAKSPAIDTRARAAAQSGIVPLSLTDELDAESPRVSISLARPPAPPPPPKAKRPTGETPARVAAQNGAFATRAHSGRMRRHRFIV